MRTPRQTLYTLGQILLLVVQCQGMQHLTWRADEVVHLSTFALAHTHIHTHTDNVHTSWRMSMTQYPITAALKERLSSILADHSYDDDTLLSDLTTAFSQAICELEQKMQSLSDIVKTQSQATPSESDTDAMGPANFVNAYKLPQIWVRATEKHQSALELIAEQCGAMPGRVREIRLFITPALDVVVGDTIIGNVADYSITMQQHVHHGTAESIGKLVYSKKNRCWCVQLGTN